MPLTELVQCSHAAVLLVTHVYVVLSLHGSPPAERDVAVVLSERDGGEDNRPQCSPVSGS